MDVQQNLTSKIIMKHKAIHATAHSGKGNMHIT